MKRLECQEERPVMLEADTTGLNPAAPARRRLLRALGLSAVATAVGVQWQRPVVSLGGLPAHAEGSALTECQVGTVAVGATREGVMSYTLYSGTSEGQTVTVEESTTNDAARWETTITGVNESIFFQCDVAWASVSNRPYSVTWEADCCTDLMRTEANGLGGTGQSLAWFRSFDDDGFCAAP